MRLKELDPNHELLNFLDYCGEDGFKIADGKYKKLFERFEDTHYKKYGWDVTRSRMMINYYNALRAAVEALEESSYEIKT